MDLINVSAQKYDIGKCAIFFYDPDSDGVGGVWDESGDLFALMTHIGTTEGEVNPEMNPEYSELTLPETSGPAALKRYLAGERPSFTVGVFPDPDKLRLFSPTGTGSAGQVFRRRVKEYTLWIVAQELFLKPDAVTGIVGAVPVTYNGVNFLKAGLPLTAEEQSLIDLSMLCWRADFERVTPRYQHDEGGKSLKEITVTIQQDFTKPDGCQLFLVVGEAVDFGVDFVGS